MHINDITTVVISKVPAGLAGEELRVQVLMRLGDMSREDAVELLRAGVLKWFDPEYDADGTVIVRVEGRDPDLIRTWKARKSGTAAEIDLEAEADEDSAVERVAIIVTDVVTDFTPGVSNLKDATIALTGVNLVTGEEVGLAGRVASAIFAIPRPGQRPEAAWQGRAHAGQGGRGLGQGPGPSGAAVARPAAAALDQDARYRHG